MGHRDDKRYGSSYDPKADRGSTAKPKSRTMTFEIVNSDGMAASLRDLRASFESMAYGGMAFTAASQPASSKPTPASYDSARASVEKWIAAAPRQQFGDIVGNDEALAQLQDAIRAPVEQKDLYEAYGMKMPKGALLAGPPGCGKTMFARAAACTMREIYGQATEFISLSGGELQSPYIGGTEAHIKAIFKFAREYQAHHGHPLLVFIDEAEVILPDRTGRIRRVLPWEESQVGTFLAEMDGMHASGAFVLLATNRPEAIDQAVLRDGRCDFKITVARPTREAIETILTKNFAGVLTADDEPEALVMAAVESLFDPHKVIMDVQTAAVTLGLQAPGKSAEAQIKVVSEDQASRHFLLEHIVSGAMAASIPARAKRYAFARDKVAGVAKGVVVQDVLAAVNDLFQENKRLDHSFALEEFRRQFFDGLKPEGATP